MNEVTEKSKYIIDKLFKTDGVKGVSGYGLMLGIETDKSASDIAKDCLEKGLLVLTAHHNRVRLLPPLTITYDEIDEGLNILKEAIEK